MQKPPNRRTFLQTTCLATGSFLWPFSSDHFAKGPSTDAQLRMIIDADTANEVDDLYAIARALIEPKFKIEGLTSAQWHTQQRAPNDTVGLSQDLNEEILKILGQTDIPHTILMRRVCVNNFGKLLKPILPKSKLAYLIE